MVVIRLSALRTDRLYAKKYSWHSFLLEVESTPVGSEGLCRSLNIDRKNWYRPGIHTKFWSGSFVENVIFKIEKEMGA